MSARGEPDAKRRKQQVSGPPPTGAEEVIAPACEAGVSTRRLKQYSRRTSSTAFVPITAGLCGARAGDVLRGVDASSGGDTANVVLRIDVGVVSAPAVIRRSVEAEVGRECVVASLAQHFRISRAAAELKYDDCPVVEAANHQPLGSGCSHTVDDACGCEVSARFTILSQGAWQEFADAHGHGEELRAMVEQRTSVCWRDVLRLMFTPGQPEGKKLILRPRLFEPVSGPVRISPEDPRLAAPAAAEIVDATVLSGCHDGAVYEIDGILVRLPASGAEAFARAEVAGVVSEVLGAEPAGPSFDVRMIPSCVCMLSRLSGGGLKSLLQKAIRFRASEVDLGDVGKVPLPVVVIIAIGLLFAEKGSFSPELQIFTRGGAAAFKRLAVIMLEDAWVDLPGCSAAHSVLALTAMALAMQRMPEYEPPRAAILTALRLASQAAASLVLIAWRTDDRTDSQSVVPPAAAESLQQSAKILRVLRSFKGDMDMFDLIAQEGKSGRLRLTRARQYPTVMPICHLVDQHAYRGIGHVMGGGGATFAARFAMLFSRCTGFNPRRETSEGFEDREAVILARFAQDCCARFVFGRGGCELVVLDSLQADIALDLDPGVLAAAVGPIPVKVKGSEGKQRDVLVLLGVRSPADEVVMLRPARATRDLFGSLSDSERAKAILYARSQSLRASSPLLPGARRAEFRDGVWQLDGRPWDEVVAEGRRLQVPVISPPSWAAGALDLDVVSDDSALAEALRTVGRGVVPHVKERISALTGTVRHGVALRAVSLLRQQYVTIAMPTPSLGGGLGSDQLAAYEGDWEVYRLLVLISRLAPGALRPTAPPNFKVVDAALLRAIERWMMEGIHIAARSQAGGLQNAASAKIAWHGHPLWQKMIKAEEGLMEHQRAAVARMHQRDTEADTGHFLVMDTGLGKTVTSLVYAYRWLCQSGGGSVKRIIWVTPAGTVENLLKQLRSTWSVPVCAVPRISTARKPKAGDATRLILQDFVVNVIHADHLRSAIDKGLAEDAPSSLIVFDEVDEMYAPTLRTSAARRLCQLCPKFVAQTATPMRKNESQLLTWLADTCAFPVDASNLLVAASGMVSMQLELGIGAKEEEVLVPMADGVRGQCRRLFHSRAWLEMARTVQAHTDEAMVDRAVRLAEEDRKSHPAGGVLLVADNLQHAEKLIAMSRKRIRSEGFASLEAPDAWEVAVVVVTKDRDRGYNSAARLGAMVTGAYAGNGASRHQIRGRLRRLGQRRGEVLFVTVVMEHSILQLLHHRHSAVDSMNISLEQLGQKFSVEVLRGLGEG